MTGFVPNDRQREAMEPAEGDVFIEAAAGSGKTAVLAGRFAEAVASGVDPEAVLAITFTRKAAGELAERVRRELLERGLTDAVDRLPAAWISTIHGLCARLLRRHWIEADLPAGFGILGEVEAAELRERAIEEALRSACGEAGVEALVDRFGIEALCDAILSAYDRCRAMGERPWGLREESPPPLAGAWEAAAASLKQVLDAHPSPPSGPTQERNVERAEEAYRRLSGMSPNDSRASRVALEIAASCSLDKRVKVTREAVEAATSSLEELASIAGRHEVAPYSRAFAALLAAFHERFHGLKELLGVLDHDDLQERTVSLLRERPDVAEEYASRFRHVMVDEFQDTNALQMQVLAPLAARGLCAVGDERQAIYGWRYADIRIFHEQRRKAGKRVSLASNYRSHPEVLSFLNRLFGSDRIFGTDLLALSPGRRSGWRVPWEEGVPRTEILLTGREGWDGSGWRKAEAAVLARRLAEVVAEGVNPGDCAVLLRSLVNAQTYADALQAQGLPYVMAQGGRLFARREVAEVERLLSVAVREHDEVSLLHLLSGRMVRLGPDALSDVFRSERPHATPPWREALREGSLEEEDAVRLTALREALDVVRESFSRRETGQGLLEACEILGYPQALCSEGADGVRAWENVRRLSRIIDVFTHEQTADPAALLRHIASRRRHDRSEPQAPVTEGGSPAVRIMTVHASKGLQFPLVAVADLGRSLPRLNDPCLLDDSGGRVRWALRLPSSRTGEPAVEPSVYRELREAAMRDQLEEEKRILYVACTRAEEVLLLSGAVAVQRREREDTPVSWLCSALGIQPLEDAGGPTWTVRTNLSPREGEAPSLPTPTDAAPLQPAGTVIADPRETVEGGRTGGSDRPAGDRPAAALPASRENEESGWRAAVLSFTSLQTHSRCPWRFYLQAALGLTAPPEAVPSAARAFGNAVHAAMRAAAGGATAERVASIIGTHDLDDRQRRRVLGAVDELLNRRIVREALEGESVSAETPFDVLVGGVRLTGSLDLLSWSGERALVIDYKTGDGEPDEGESGLQARCYATALLRAGAPAVSVAFVRLAEEQPMVHVFRADELDALERDLERRVEETAKSPYSRLARHDPVVCADCPGLHGLCDVSAPRRSAA